MSTLQLQKRKERLEKNAAFLAEFGGRSAPVITQVLLPVNTPDMDVIRERARIAAEEALRVEAAEAAFRVAPEAIPEAIPKAIPKATLETAPKVVTAATKVEELLGEEPLQESLHESLRNPTPHTPIPREPKIRFKKQEVFRLNTGRVILEAFDQTFEGIDPEGPPLNFLIFGIGTLSIAAVVETLKADENSIILIYSEKIASHKKHFDAIKENLFGGFQIMARDIHAKRGNLDTKAKQDFDFVKAKRTNLFKRLFLMSVQKNAGFDFPMINGLLLFFSVLLHGKKKVSDFEYLMSDPELGNYEIPLKQLIIEEGDDRGETVGSFLHNNFFVQKKKIYFVSNEFYLPGNGKKSALEYEHLRILTGLTRDDLDHAVMEKKKIDQTTEEHQIKVLLDKAPNYRGKTKVLVDAYFDPIKARAFIVTGVTPVGYKLCHNIVNYVDHIGITLELATGSTAGSTELFRFFDVIPPAMFYLKETSYNKLAIRGYLEKHPITINQSWFGNGLTYAQTEKMLNTMTAKKAKLDDVFEDLLLDFEKAADSFTGKATAKTPGDEVTVACYIFFGDKYSGKSFIAKRFTEYLDDVIGDSASVTILNEYKAKLNGAIGNGKGHIVIDSPMLNKEYNRRTFKRDMAEKVGTWVTIEYVFINVHTINAFRNMLIKYTKSAYPTEYSTSIDPKGFFQSNPKNQNVLDITNCFWIDASRDTPDFSFEIGRQIH